MADPVRVAIEQRLKASTGLTALLGQGANGIYHRRAPQPSKPPVVVFSKRSGTRLWNFGGELAAIDERWIVRCVAYGRTADRAEDVAAQIEIALSDAQLTITGRHLLALYLEEDVDYPEQVGKELFQHCGGVYRVMVEPSP